MDKTPLTPYIFEPFYECMPSDQLSDLQNKRLVSMLHHLDSGNSFYHEKFESSGMDLKKIRSVENLRELPFTTKEDLKSHYPFGLFSVPFKNIVHIHASSGTTGKPTIVGYSKNDLDQWFHCVARGLAAAGIRPGVIVQNSYPFGLSTGGFGFQEGAEMLGAFVIPISSGNHARQIDFLKDLHVDVLMCNPNFAGTLLSLVDEAHLDPEEFEIKTGVFGGEAWSEALRHRLEERFGIVAFDAYGLSEITGPGVAYECEKHCGLHINEDCFFAEIVDFKTGEPVSKGEFGELIFTTLAKEAMPLLRYRTHDRTRFLEGNCECGRTSRRIERIADRIEDQISFGGHRISPNEIETILLDFDEIEPLYQVIVKKTTSQEEIEIYAGAITDSLKEPDKLTSIERKISEILKQKLGFSSLVHLKPVSFFIPSEGKAKRILHT